MASHFFARVSLVLTCLSLLPSSTYASPASASVSSTSSTSTTSTSFSATAVISTTSAAPTTSNGKNAKRGLSYPDTDNLADVLNINQTKSLVSWQYDWGLTPPPNLAQSGVQYIPMQWGSGGIENLSQALQAQNATILLTFNEPDFNEQSNIDPNTAAKLWAQYIEPLRTTMPGIRIGAPAVSSDTTGVPWLMSFFGACTNCTFDFLPIHWYGEGVEGFYSYLFQLYSQFGNRTIWVTEYADTSLTDSDVTTFMNQTTAYMDTLDFVERYAWFGYFRPQNGSAYNMMNTNGSLNALGQLYLGADTVETSGAATNTAAGIPAGGGGGPTQALGTASVGSGSAPIFSPNSAGSIRLGNTWGPISVVGWIVYMWIWMV